MEVQIQLILTVYIVNFGLISLQTLNQMVDQAVPRKHYYNESAIQENFQTLFDSIGKNKANKNEMYHEILKQNLVSERNAFQAMKEELEVARDRNTYETRNFYTEDNIHESVTAVKREADENYRSLNFTKFKQILRRSRSILVITGDGISVESGIPMLRGANAYYKNREVRLLKTQTSFRENPSLVWEFIEYRRRIILTKKPNKAHYALAEFEKLCQQAGRKFTIVTQTTDGLHKVAGSQNVFELYGSILKTKCTVCGNTYINLKSPIVPVFARRGHKPNGTKFNPIPVEKLPRCEIADCGGLLRPDIVFFGEDLHHVDRETNLDKFWRGYDLCLLIGNSAKLYPVNEFANNLVWRRVPIAEFTTEPTPQSTLFQFHFTGAYSKTVPEALALDGIPFVDLPVESTTIDEYDNIPI